MFQIKPMDQQEAEEYLRWSYAEPYDFYNTPVASFSECLTAILDPTSGEDLYAVYREGRYFGIFSYKINGQSLELGLGMRPEECGKHQGVLFTALGVAFARSQLRHRGKIWLRVADFNQRAIRTYETAGFTEVEQQLALSWDRLVNFIHMELTDEEKLQRQLSAEQDNKPL